MKQIVGEITVNWDILRKSTWNLCKIHIYTPILYSLTVHGSHTLLQISFHFTQFLTKNIKNSTRKYLHMSHNIAYSKICHKYIHIIAWKDQKEKK